jgi:RNA polymerase sigma-70 factor (ECF subfamily)
MSRRFCDLIVRDRDEAADIAQETFIIAYQKILSYDPQYAFATWLFTIARRRSLTVIRRAKRFVPEGTDFMWLESTVQSQEAQQYARDVRAAVARLPRRYREVVALHYWQGLTYQEIAHVLGTTEGSIKGWMSRAKVLLRKDLA